MSDRCRPSNGCHHRRVAPKTAAKTDSRLAARLAALASLGASVIHFAVVPAHWQEWMPAGLFFASIAIFQLLWARLILTRTTTPVLAIGIMLSLGAIALWAVSRTAGSPFGPHAGVPEVVQAADLCALLLQVYVVMAAGWVWYRGLQGDRVSALGSAIVLMGALGVVALASTVGVVSGIRHGHHSPAGAEGDHHDAGVEHADGHQGRNPESISPPQSSEPVGTPTAPPPVNVPVPSAVPLDDGHGHRDHDE